jgi:CHAT domain-containing protein/Tfp pilus assembly protein PilF
MFQARKWVALFAAFLAASLYAPHATAQQPLWQQLNAQSTQLYQQGRYAEALPIAIEALKAAEEAFGPDSAWVAADLNNLAQNYNSQGRYTEAEPLFQRALQVQEKVAGPDDRTVATFLSNIGLLYDNEGRYPEAEPLYLRAVRIHEKTAGIDHPDVAVDLNNLSVLYHHQGRYAEAETLCQRALRIDEKALGQDNPKIAADLNNFAALYYDQGKYAAAEPFYQRALSIYEKAFGPDHPAVAAAINNLAALYMDQGKFEQAEPLYRRAVRIGEKALGPDNPDVARYLNNLALLCDEEGKEAEAELLYLRALSVREKALGPDHPEVATGLSNLASFYMDKGDYAKARPLFLRALHITEKALGPDHPEVAKDLNNLAVLYHHQDLYAETEPLFLRALRIKEKALGPDHPDVAMELNNLAILYGDQGKYVEAEPMYRRLFDNLFQQFQYNFNYMTEKERLGFLDTLEFNFPAFFSFVYRFRSKDPSLAGSMYDLLLWEKGLIAGSVADMRREIEASGDTEALKLLGRLTATRTQIAALLNTEPPDRELWRQQINQLRSEANDIEKALVARSSAFAERKQLERATWQQVRDSLKPGEAAVEFARFRLYDKKWTGTRYYVALVVTPETKGQPEYVFLGDDKQIEGDMILRFKHSVQTRGLLAEPEIELPGADTYALIWKPLEKALVGRTRIYLSPDGVLNQLPLGIIPTPDGKLLMERYDIHLLSSTRDILRSAPPPAATTALLVGNPVFDLSEEQQRVAIEKLALPQPEAPTRIAALLPGGVSRDQGSGSALQGLPRLPGTGAEVASIAELMQEHQWKTSVYTNELALKTVVERAGSPRVIHLATHGFFLSDQQIKMERTVTGDSQASGIEDPMLRSGLYFAGANRTLAGKPAGEGLDNGVLTAMEAGSLNLRGTQLVVLSACNTGQGDVKNGEGVFGLRRAFEEAGAESVLMSLWSVPDRETLELMQRFYKKWLGGIEIHEALKEAQLEMREQVRKSHNGKDLPYYWGAFVLVGR